MSSAERVIRFKQVLRVKRFPSEQKNKRKRQKKQAEATKKTKLKRQKKQVRKRQKKQIVFFVSLGFFCPYYRGKTSFYDKFSEKKRNFSEISPKFEYFFDYNQKPERVSLMGSCVFVPEPQNF